MYRDRFPSSCKKLRFFLGDVREPDSLRAPMEGVNYVIHAAALKQVPSCEFFPHRSGSHQCTGHGACAAGRCVGRRTGGGLPFHG